MTYTEVTKEVGEFLATMPGAVASYRRFFASNGVNYTEKSYDLPGGAHLEFVCQSPQTTCLYRWLYYSPAAVIVESNAPTPFGFHTGRPSDLDVETLGRFNRALAEAEKVGGWKLRYEVSKLYKETYHPKTEAQIAANRERAANLRFGSSRA